MTVVEELTGVLRRLNSGKESKQAKVEAKELMRRVSPLELSLAEQTLIQEGVKPEELGKLCDIHLEILGTELEKFQEKLEEGHPIDTFIAEHDEILKFLKELEATNDKIQREGIGTEELNLFRYLATHLLEAEKHHKREEDVLFPELENRGVTGPPRIMRLEHDELRLRKKKLYDLVNGEELLKSYTLKRTLDEVVKYITFNLRDHIYKENYILYPTAIESIKSSETWHKIKAECDKIGYCSFTPKR